MEKTNKLTFEQGCNLYLDNCRQRNLRDGTINHYKNSYIQLYKFFSPDMPLSDITPSLYNNYIDYLKTTLNNDVTISSRLRDLITTLHFLMNQGTEDYLFCNVFGQQLIKSTCYNMLYQYNRNRGVQTTGIHRYRHTFAKQWILNGGNVVTLSHILGHSSLAITQNYINLLVTDLAKQVDEINLLDQFNAKQHIKLHTSK